MADKPHKLFPKDVRNLVRLYRTGARVVDIAEKFKVSIGYVSVIAKRHGLTRMPQKNRPKIND